MGGRTCHAKPSQLCTLPGTKNVGRLFLSFLGKILPSLEAKWRKDFGSGSTQFRKTMCPGVGSSEDRSCSVFWQCCEGLEAVPPKAVEIATLQGWTRGCLLHGGNCVQSSTLSISTWLDEGSKMLFCSHNRFKGGKASDQKHGLSMS